MRHAITKRDNAGFTYLTLMLVIVVMGALLGAAAEVWHTAVQREKERELLFAGRQFRTAIGLYYVKHAKYPHNLEDLLKDPQYPSTQRYLRKIYRDPMTGKNEWGLLRMADGGIAGVHSLSENSPIKVAGFGATGGSFDGAVKYSDWVFVYRSRKFSPVPAANADLSKRAPLR